MPLSQPLDLLHIFRPISTTMCRTSVYRMAATSALYARPETSEDSSAPRRGLAGAAEQLRGSASGSLTLVGGPTAEPSWLPSATSAVPRSTVGRPRAPPLGVAAQEGGMPAVPSSPCPRPRPASGVRCPLSGASVQRPRVRVTRLLSSVRCGRVRVSGVPRPVSRGGASGVRALPCPPCPTGRSWRVAVGQVAARLRSPGSESPAVSTIGSRLPDSET
jgi:hypothetical protein